IDHDRKRRQILAAKVSLVGSIVLFILSFSVGIAVDSITLLLDASASLIILVVALLMHVSIEKLHKKPDDTFNFGYEKYEPLTVVVQGILIIATCVVSMKFAIQDIIHPDDIHGYFLPVISTFLCGIIGVSVFSYLKMVSKRTGSSIMKAASLHWLTDTVLSFGVFVGFLTGLVLHGLGYTRITPYIDPAMAIILAAFLIRVPVKTVTHSVLELLDAVPHGDGEKVKKLIERYKPASFAVHEVKMRKAGEKIFIHVCFNLKDDSSTRQIAQLFEAFERDLKGHFNNCDLTICFKHL
ncbi:MAG: cation diffusion facilitator family transporter, partial [Candidatus Omnitrophica bacterium]|nr:cation diffusion facilitator family transporter [Candidatus Omnitrophota bacterium]